MHVERESCRAKFWLQPVRLEDSTGFARVELRTIERIVSANLDVLLGAWHEFFGD